MNSAEIKKLNEDRKAMLHEIDLFHEDFANNLKKSNLHEKIKSVDNKIIKKPLKMRIVNFIKRLVDTLI